ncbi:MAG: CGNR zinc finger domain-containing protein [Solirubrobacteraceae bacterium]
MSLPAFVSPDEDKPAPMPLLRVQSLINTRDREKQSDELAELDSARAWLTAADLLGPGMPLDDQDLARVREFREGLRALVGRRVDELDGVRTLTSGRAVTVEVDAHGGVQLSTEDGLLGLLLTVRDAQAEGSWSRLKLCSNPDCGRAFYDRSRNQQGAWCSMATCGNRLKNRRFRARGER